MVPGLCGRGGVDARSAWMPIETVAQRGIGREEHHEGWRNMGLCLCTITTIAGVMSAFKNIGDTRNSED